MNPVNYSELKLIVVPNSFQVYAIPGICIPTTN